MSFRQIFENNDHSSQEILDLIHNCNCCVIHQQKRPRFYSPWIETTSTREQCERFPSDPNACPCDCRQTARSICRRPEVLSITEYDSASSGRSTPLSECID